MRVGEYVIGESAGESVVTDHGSTYRLKKKKERRRTETCRRLDQSISVIAQLRQLTGNSPPENNISLIIRVIIIILLKLRMRMDAGL